MTSPADSPLRNRVASAVAAVRQRMAAALERSGRPSDAVRLVAVSKYASTDDGVIEALLAAGCTDLGESRPQHLVEKAEHFSGPSFPEIRWHLIGSLQRNKVRKVLPFCSLIHSIDSIDLAETINRIAEEEAIPQVHGLLEVNISGDAAKHGFTEEELKRSLDAFAPFTHLHIDGLMCMAGLDSDQDQIRREFSSVRHLSHSIASNSPQNMSMTDLSMGMSSDFEIAIEEGATLIRIGSLLYGS